MKLEDYFDFYSANDIRLKGHRVGIENILDYYLEGYTPEEINGNLPSLSLEEIHATITYYLHNRPQIDTYLADLTEDREQRYQEFYVNPPAIVRKLQAEMARRVTKKR
ncbi:DUF433 domain-containing protein [Xenococcus sp. PCC 7305]|uniref:DUF433 domain-containing protein n=1 Tax=Xenococcus sp. PCC 7305 TaxID=102125 RepID=UPI000594C7DB